MKKFYAKGGANETPFNNTNTELSANNVQDAIVESYTLVSVLSFGAFDDPTKTIEQAQFFQAAADAVGSTGEVIIPEGDYYIGSDITTDTTWRLEPGVGIHGLPVVPPANYSDTSRLGGQMQRYLTPSKSSMVQFGDPTYKAVKNRGLATTGTVLALSCDGSPGVTGAVVASLQDGSGISGIGVQGIASNDNTSTSVNLWGAYFEVEAFLGIQGNCISNEVNSTNKNTTAAFGPNQQPSRDSQLTAGSWISSGRGEVDDKPSSLAIGILDAGEKWDRGIVFFHGSLVNKSSFKEAVALEDEAAFVWYPANGTASDALPIAWIKGRDKGADGSGRINAHIEELLTGESCDYQLEATQLTPTDNQANLGGPSNRWNEVYAINAAINTSDERDKEQGRSLNDAEIATAKECKSLIKMYKWKDAVSEKGYDARWHCGAYAQEVKQVFERNGLDAHQYGILCYDSWEKSEDEGVLTPAGERYGLRYNELMCFIISAL